MTSTEAKHIAEGYVLKMGEVLPGFRFGIGDETEFMGKYYFDFIWLTLEGKRPKEPPVAGGARGLTVDKQDKKVELTSQGGYGALMHSENELTKTYQLLVDFKNRKKRLTEIKDKFSLNSEQLMELSKLIRNTELNKEKTYELLNTLLARVTNKR